MREALAPRAAMRDRVLESAAVLTILIAAPVAGVFVAAANPVALVLSGAVLGLGVVFVISAASPRAAFGLVFAAALLGGLPAQTPFGVLRLEQALVMPALLGVLVRFVMSRPNATLPSRSHWLALIITLLGGYVFVNLLSTLLMAIDTDSSLRIVLWMALSLAACLLTVLVAQAFSDVQTLLRDVQIIAAVAAGAGVVLYVLFLLGVQGFGVQSDVAGVFFAKGTFHEANLLGSFAAMSTVLATALLAYEPEQSVSRRQFLWFCLAVGAAGTFVSFTRAAWVALAISAVAILLVARPAHARARIVGAGGLALAAGAAVLFAVGALGPAIDRITSLLTDGTGTIAYRSADYGRALSRIPESLWIGFGTNSYGQHYLDPSQNYGPSYLGGLFLATLWDAGVVGLGLLLAAFTLVALALRAASSRARASTRSHAIALGAAFLAALVAYQSTNGFWFAYNWMLIGLAVALAGRTVDGPVDTELTEGLPVLSRRTALRSP